MMLMYGGPPQGRGGRSARETLERLARYEQYLRHPEFSPVPRDLTIPGLRERIEHARQMEEARKPRLG